MYSLAVSAFSNNPALLSLTQPHKHNLQLPTHACTVTRVIFTVPHKHTVSRHWLRLHDDNRSRTHVPFNSFSTNYSWNPLTLARSRTLSHVGAVPFSTVICYKLPFLIVKYKLLFDNGNTLSFVSVYSIVRNKSLWWDLCPPSRNHAIHFVFSKLLWRST